MRYLIDQSGRKLIDSHRIDADGRKVVGQTEDLQFWVASDDGRTTVEATLPVAWRHIVDDGVGPAIGVEPLRWADTPTPEGA